MNHPLSENEAKQVEFSSRYCNLKYPLVLIVWEQVHIASETEEVYPSLAPLPENQTVSAGFLVNQDATHFVLHHNIEDGQSVNAMGKIVIPKRLVVHTVRLSAVDEEQDYLRRNPENRVFHPIAAAKAGLE
jgi:hypothetical protein